MPNDWKCIKNVEKSTYVKDQTINIRNISSKKNTHPDARSEPVGLHAHAQTCKNKCLEGERQRQKGESKE